MEKTPISLSPDYTIVKLKPNTIGVYYCLDCEKVIGQVPEKNGIRSWARQDAAFYVRQTNHRVEEVLSEIEATRLPKRIRSLPNQFRLSNMLYVFQER